MAQWLRLCTLTARAQVRSLVGALKDPTCCKMRPKISLKEEEIKLFQRKCSLDDRKEQEN